MSRTTLVLVALVGTVGLVAAPVPKGVKKKADYFPVVVGNKWEYRDSRERSPVPYEVTRVTTDPDGTKTVEVSFGNTDPHGAITYRSSAAGVEEVRVGTEPLDPSDKFLTVDLRPGDEWETTFRHARTNYHSGYRVRPAEELTVPAGKFKAIPVTCTRPDEAGTGTDEITRWYADGIGMVKMECRTSSVTITQELVKFTPSE